MIAAGTTAFYGRAQAQGSRLRDEAERLQTQIATGQRLTRPSDDPLAASRLRTLVRQDQLAQADRHVADQAAGRLHATALALESAVGVVIRAKELATEASSATASDTGRKAIGEELSTLAQTLLSLANSRDASGQPLFGGEAAGPAYAPNGVGATYLGTAAAPLVNVGEAQRVAAGLTGPEVFGSPAGTGAGAGMGDLFTALGTLAAALKTGDAAGATVAGDTLAALDAGLDRLAVAQASVGTRLGAIETATERRTVRGELIAAEQATIGGTDLALTISRLQHTLTVLEASQTGFAKLANLSLFNLLR